MTGFDLDDRERAELLAGRIPTRLESFKTPRGKSAGRGFGVVRIARPAEVVWRTITTFHDRVEYVPRLEAVHVLATAGTRLRVRQLSDATIKTVSTTCWFELHEPELRMSWRLDPTAPDNDIADVEGEYRVVPEGASCLLGYRAYVDTGLWIPQAIQSRMQTRAIPELLAAIKARVER